MLNVPAHREAALRRIGQTLDGAHDIALTTHVNADGDGAGSEIALAAWLAARGKRVRLVNPTPFPDSFRFLVRDDAWVADAATPAGAEALRQADALVVLDTGEKSRIGRVAPAARGRTVVLLDHHPPGGDRIDAVELRDPGACATGELVFDLLWLHEQDEWPEVVAEALYTAIVTDTGSFRFSNTTPRTHAIAAELIRRGVDPESMYRRIYGSVPLHRVRLLQRALATLEVDPEQPIAWLTIPRGAMEELGATSDDLDGLIEHARSVRGTEVALLFRPTVDGATKVSFRSNGAVDVNALARAFGGGGHAKAAGAVVGKPLESARAEVLRAVREAVRLVADRAPV